MEKGEKKGEQERKTHDARGRRWMERKRGIEKGEGRRGTTTVEGRRATGERKEADYKEIDLEDLGKCNTRRETGKEN